MGAFPEKRKLPIQRFMVSESKVIKDRLTT